MSLDMDNSQSHDLMQGLVALRTEIARVIVGQEELIERMLIGLLTGGHLLLEGVPGLAKTTAVRALAQALSLNFSRIQFTPDLLPADILGTQIYQPQTASFSTHQGPIFANLVLADEVNRAPAKVQAALLEAMQERQVTIGKETFSLPEPFLVLATQNPIEQEGTYPLPEAQVDRFMLKLRVDYPSRDEERRILMMGGSRFEDIRPVLSAEHILYAQAMIRQVGAEPALVDYVVDLVRATRDPGSVEMGLERYVDYGASPRASIALLAAARAHAFLRGRGFVTPDDVKAVGLEVLRHRVVLSYEAEAEGWTSDAILERLFQKVDVH